MVIAPPTSMSFLLSRSKFLPRNLKKGPHFCWCNPPCVASIFDCFKPFPPISLASTFARFEGYFRLIQHVQACFNSHFSSSSSCFIMFSFFSPDCTWFLHDFSTQLSSFTLFFTHFRWLFTIFPMFFHIFGPFPAVGSAQPASRAPELRRSRP